MSKVPGFIKVKQSNGFSATWTLCSSTRTAAAQMTPPSDDTLMIRFMFYKETLHTFTEGSEGIEEAWIIPKSPTKAITIRPSDFFNHNAKTIEQTPSGKMMVNFIKAHFIPKFVSNLVSTIIDLVQSSIGSETKGFVDVRLRNTLKLRHLPEDEANMDSIRCYLKATRRGTCAICIDDYEIGHDNGVRLPCSHCFHGTCISEWLVIKPSCPVCSNPLLSLKMLFPWFNPPVQEGIWLSHSTIQS